MASPAELLDALNSSDNAARRAAENALTSMAEGGLEQLVAALTSTLCNDPSKERKLQASIQLRRMLSAKEHLVRVKKLAAAVAAGAQPAPAGPLPSRLASLPPATLGGLKAGLLHSFRHDTISGVRTNVAAALAEIAGQIAGEGCRNWPELLQTVFDGAGSGDVERQASALKLLGMLVEFAGPADRGRDMILPHAGPIGGMLSTLLGTPTVAPKARVAALSTVACLLPALQGTAGATESFQALIPGMVATLQSAFAPGVDPDNELSGEALCELTNMVIAVPTFFRPHLSAVCGAMVTILAAAGSLSDDTRSYALEFLLILAETAGGTVRKVPQLSETVIDLTLKTIQTYEDEDTPLEEWGKLDDKEDTEDAEDGNMHSVGVRSLARYASAIGEKQAWPIFQKVAGPLFSSALWQARAAAVTGLAQVASACARDMGKHMGFMVKTCETFLGDAHPRVAHAAARALETLITTCVAPALPCVLRQRVAGWRLAGHPCSPRPPPPLLTQPPPPPPRSLAATLTWTPWRLWMAMCLSWRGACWGARRGARRRAWPRALPALPPRRSSPFRRSAARTCCLPSLLPAALGACCACAALSLAPWMRCWEGMGRRRWSLTSLPPMRRTFWPPAARRWATCASRRASPFSFPSFHPFLAALLHPPPPRAHTFLTSLPPPPAQHPCTLPCARTPPQRPQGLLTLRLRARACSTAAAALPWTWGRTFAPTTLRCSPRSRALWRACR